MKTIKTRGDKEYHSSKALKALRKKAVRILEGKKRNAKPPKGMTK